MVARGALIVIEGMDRAGKTTQTKQLIESLATKKVAAERMAFPDRSTWTGQLISKYLGNAECKINDQTVHLLFAANRWENVEKMRETLDNGTTLIVDRYSHSGIAFSTAKGLDTHWCTQPEIGLPKPDLILLLHLDQKKLAERNGFGAERYETHEMQAKVDAIFNQFARTENNWRTIDASRSFADVQNELLKSAEEIIDHVRQQRLPLQYF